MAQTQQRRQTRQQPAQQPPRQQQAVAIIEQHAQDIQQLPLDRALDLYGANFAPLLPENVTVDAFKRMVITAVNTNLELAAGDRRTLFNACCKAAHDGLMPDGNEAALVLYRQTKIKNRYGQEERIDAVQYMPMVNGIKKRLWNSGFVASIEARAIYQNDSFRRWTDEHGPHIAYEPAPLDKEPGPIIGAFAVIYLLEGRPPLIDVMRKADIEKSRQQSKTPNSFMWEKFYDQACVKTVLRRCGKGAPQAAMLMRILERDDEEPGVALPGEDRQLITGPRPVRSDYPDGGTNGGTQTESRQSSPPSPPPPPPEPTLEIADSEGVIEERPVSTVADALLTLFEEAAKRQDKGEARRAVATLASNNQQTIVELRQHDAAGADAVVARYREVSAELDPFGLPGTGQPAQTGENAQAGTGAAKQAEPSPPAPASGPQGGRPASGSRKGFPPLERFQPGGAPNWPKWATAIITLIRTAPSRARLVEIGQEVNRYRIDCPGHVIQDIDLAMDDRSREVPS